VNLWVICCVDPLNAGPLRDPWIYSATTHLLGVEDLIKLQLLLPKLIFEVVGSHVYIFLSSSSKKYLL